MATTKVVFRFTGDQTQVLDKSGDVEQTAPDIIFGFTINCMQHVRIPPTTNTINRRVDKLVTTIMTLMVTT